MLLSIERYIKKYAIRKKDQVTSPISFTMKEFILPINTHLHFLGKDDGAFGIRADNPLVVNNDKSAVVSQFIFDYIEPRSETFRKVTVDKKQLVQNYIKTNRGITDARFSASAAALPKNILVTNYGLIDEGVKYVGEILVWWRQYQNTIGTLFKNIEQDQTKGNRQHFVVFDLPSSFPTISQMRKFENNDDRQLLERIGSPERMFVCQLWLWLANNEKTLFPLDPVIASKINMVVRADGEWMVFNLQSIKDYIRTYNPKGSYTVIQAQKAVTAMLMYIKYGTLSDAGLDDHDEAEPIDLAEPTDSKLAQFDTKSENKRISNIREFAEKSIALAKDDIGEDGDDVVDLQEEVKLNKIDKFLGELDDQEAEAAALADVNPDPDVIEQQTKESDKANEAVVSDGVVSIDNLGIDYKAYTPPEDDIDSRFDAKLKEAILAGKLTPQQVKRLERLSRTYKTLPDPKGKHLNLEVASTIDPEELVINKDDKFTDAIAGVTDESMLKSTLMSFDKKYINNVMDKDIYKAVLWFQRSGFCITDYKTRPVVSLGTEYIEHTVKIVPINGKESTVKFKIPVFDENGVMESRGVKSALGIQRVDVGIRKIDYDTVAMTSYMSKIFVNRSEYAAYSKERWLKAKLVEMVSDETNSTELVFGNVFNREGDVPIEYSTYARTVKYIKAGEREFFFAIDDLEKNFGADVAKVFNKTRATQVLVGKGKNTLLVLTTSGIVHECSIDGASTTEIGTIDEIIGLPSEKAPLDSVDIRIVNKSIPVGIVLAYYLGLGNLLKTLGVKYRVIPKNTRGVEKTKGKPVVVFKDCSLLIDECDYKSSMIIESFNRYGRLIKDFEMFEFDKRAVYSVVASNAGLPGRYIRELEILRDMWVGPIDHELFTAMQEPTDFVLLILRAVELLEKDQHPEEMSREHQRDRGYERISGMVYSNLIDALRVYKSNPIPDNAQLSMNPNAVWMTMIEDDNFSGIEESNPIHALKERERVTYRGLGGRTARTMNAKTRMFSKSAIGVDSESTVDNGDAGTVRFLSANPNYTSLRGTVGVLDAFDESVNSSCLNTSHLLAPGIDRDD